MRVLECERVREKARVRESERECESVSGRVRTFMITDLLHSQSMYNIKILSFGDQTVWCHPAATASHPERPKGALEGLYT